jgi:hypothetical protein
MFIILFVLHQIYFRSYSVAKLGFLVKTLPTKTWTGPKGSQVSKQSVHEGCKPCVPAAFTPQEIFLVLISVRSFVRPEGLFLWNTPMTQSEINPAAFQLLRQYVHQQGHRVTGSFARRSLMFLCVSASKLCKTKFEDIKILRVLSFRRL